LSELVAGRIAPIIQRTYRLEEVGDAHSQLGAVT
jgi:hypothetical protein